MLQQNRDHSLSIDEKRLLTILQTDGRIPIDDLSVRLGLSDEQTRQKLEHLEQSGYIKGYQAIIDVDRLTTGFRTYLLIAVGHQTANNHKNIEHFATNEPSITECVYLSGGYEYMMKVCTKDIASYRILTAKLYRYIPDIMSIDNKPVLKTIKSQTRSLTGDPSAPQECSQ